MKRLITILSFLFIAAVSNAQILRDTTFTVPVYEIGVRVVIAIDLADVTSDIDRTALAATYVESDTVIIIFRAPFSPSTLFHEVQHAVNFVCIERGMTHDVENDEPQAYLSGYIGERIVELMLRK